MAPQNKTDSPKTSKKFLWIITIVVILLFFGSKLFFSGVVFLLHDLSFSGSKKNSADFLFGTSEPRDYSFHAVSQSVREKKANCQELYLYTSKKEKNKIYCANLYNTTEEDLEAVLSEDSFDRIVLYGEKMFLDVEANKGLFSASKIIDLARFTDQITVPAMMELYGITDFNYIGKAYAPYPALHLALNSDEKINEGHTNKSSGYAYIYWANMTDNFYLTTPKSTSKSYVRQDMADRITINYSWPENCYVSQGMLHELNHNFAMIKMAPTAKDGYFLLPNWFDEQVASFAYAIFPEYVCGPGTIKSYKTTINNVVGDKNLIEFNSIMPPANLYNGKTGWYKTNCQKAIMVSWYRFIGKGDLKTQFREYATLMRKVAKTVNLRGDNALAAFISGLHGTAEAKNFLIQNGCQF